MMMEQQELLDPTILNVTEIWKPDMVRFRREVEDTKNGAIGDGLTLAEMECSLDLINADIMALLAARRADDRTAWSLVAANDLKKELTHLIDEMRRHYQT